MSMGNNDKSRTYFYNGYNEKSTIGSSCPL